jgi:iron(III) transport system substrate-binding protein
VTIDSTVRQLPDNLRTDGLVTLSAMTRSDRRISMRLIAVLAGACALALTACSSSSSSSSSVSSTATPPSSASAAAASKVTLVVYSAQGYDSAMTKAFTAATGIPVKLDDNSTGPLLTQIEASKNNPNWGLLWVDGATAFAGLDTQGLLLKGFEPNVQWNALGTQSVPSDKSYVPTGVTLMAALAYNKQKVKSPPASWQALLSSQWKGQVGMNDPSQSGPTFPFIAGMMNYLGGVGAGESYFTKLKANGLIIHPTNGPTLQALTSGQINLALVQSSAAIGAQLGDKNLGIAYLNPVTLLPSAIGIDAKAPAAEQAEAEKFIEFVLSPAGQHVMQTGDPTGDSLYYPVIQGVSPLSALPSLASAHTQSINPYTWGPQEATINTWFDNNIVR